MRKVREEGGWDGRKEGGMIVAGIGEEEEEDGTRTKEGLENKVGSDDDRKLRKTERGRTKKGEREERGKSRECKIAQHGP